MSISFPSKTVLSFGIIFYIKNNLKLKDEETKIKVHNQLNKFQENVLKFL